MNEAAHPRRRRRGFTLVELLVASAIALLMATATFSFFFGSQRFLKLTLARAEFSLQAREIRDRLLFHLPVQTTANLPAPGLVAAANVTPQAVQPHALTLRLASFKTKTGTIGEQDYTVKPENITFSAPGTSLTASNRFFATYSRAITVGGITVRHDERIVLPLLGQKQPSLASGGGGL